MENDKCSSPPHFEIDATIYCSQCKIYMCDDCKRYHQEKRPNHKICDLNSTKKEMLYKEIIIMKN